MRTVRESSSTGGHGECQTVLNPQADVAELRQLLQPRMSDVYRQRVTTLCEALEDEASRAGVVDAIRELIERIHLEPDGGRLK